LDATSSLGSLADCPVDRNAAVELQRHLIPNRDQGGFRCSGTPESSDDVVIRLICGTFALAPNGTPLDTEPLIWYTRSMTHRGRLQEARRAKGLTQTQLAVKLGTTQSMVARYEGDQVDPSVRVALAIAKLLDQTVEDLFGEPK
jgi:putative transcriptional regulator